MTERGLVETARTLVGSGRGLLAMDESNGTCNKRFAAAGIAQTAEIRRDYRDLLVTTPGLGDGISGAILFDETIRQETCDGVPFAEALTKLGILPGIKVDRGAVDLAGHLGEKVTEGLDGLRGRLAEYAGMGARFAKWRAVIAMDAGLPSEACMAANAHALARYAGLCQEAGLVPIVEPEVLMEGGHTLEQCLDVTTRVLHAVFAALGTQEILLEAVILKPNMVLPGLDCPVQEAAPEVAAATVTCLLRTVPAAVGGIAFLSGGQTGPLATARLNAMNQARPAAAPAMPWHLVFSFARALQMPTLDIWGGKAGNRAAAQDALRHRLRCNVAALHGEYSDTTDSATVVS